MSELHRNPANCDQSKCSPAPFWKALLLSGVLTTLGTAAIADTELAYPPSRRTPGEAQRGIR